MGVGICPRQRRATAGGRRLLLRSPTTLKDVLAIAARIVNSCVALTLFLKVRFDFLRKL